MVGKRGTHQLAIILIAACVSESVGWAVPCSQGVLEMKCSGSKGRASTGSGTQEEGTVTLRRGFGLALLAPIIAAPFQNAVAAPAAGTVSEPRSGDGAPRGGEGSPKKFIKTDSGLKYYDMQEGAGGVISKGCRVNFHFSGRLAGRNGKLFEDTSRGEPVRATLGQGQLIAGLEEGLVGMREGGSRRILIPSVLGYTDRKVGPIPRDAGMRNRLYSTVMNTERSERERKALGADIVGVILADVQITRVFCDAKDAL